MSAPLVDPRAERMALAQLMRDLPGYTPEGAPREGSAAYAAMQAFARLAGILDDRLKRVPERNLLAGLDMLGVHLLPARAARVPVAFSVMPDAPLDVTLAAGSQVAAAPEPVAPSLERDAKTAPAEPLVFSTERTVTLSRGKLACLYSIEPGADRYADHSANIARGFTLFDGMKLTPHHLYLGHDVLFALGGSIVLILSFILQERTRKPLEPEPPRQEPMDLAWEYYTESGWVPLPYNLEDDTTGGLTANGQVTLRHECGPNAKKKSFAGRESYWLRARLLTALAPLAIAPLVTVNDIRARVQFGKEKLLPDGAFADGVALDVSKDFYPFGQTPVLSSAFYLSCKEAFERAGANVRIDFTLSRNGGKQSYTGSDLGGTFKLEWEFSTERGWEPLFVEPSDPPYEFGVAQQKVIFACPSQWAEREVNGVRKRWLRVRISGGDFGRPLRVSGFDTKTSLPTFSPSNLAPPVVQKAAVGFTYLTDPEPLHHCVTWNDFVFEDVTEAALWPDQRFVPFTPVSDRTPSVHFGLDRAPPVGLVSFYVDVPEQEARWQAASPFVWDYRAADGWRELTVLDETNGFRRSGMIQFIGPLDAVPADGLGGRLYRLRARLKQGEAMMAAPVGGIWLNAVWAAERRRVERELAGRSDGNPRQSFQLRRTPVLEGETVEVEEWTGNGNAWRSVLSDVPETGIRLETDPATGAVVSAWVRWHEREHFYESGPRDRHYALERATGILRLGRNAPSAGKRIAASYASGGGVTGNVAAGAVKELRTAAPYIAGAANPVAASGGADRESIDGVLRSGPQYLRHRGRALSAQDLEWLALEASPEIARVRCLPLAGPDGSAQRGWVTLVVVPRSLDARPALSAELARDVLDHVAARAPAGVRFRIVGPQYAAVSVRSVVVPVDAAEAARVEARVRGALDRFLHPLGGGREGRGWGFGESVHLSQIAAVIEGVAGVEHAEHITPLLDGVLSGASMDVAAQALVSAGPHELTLRVGVL